MDGGGRFTLGFVAPVWTTDPNSREKPRRTDQPATRPTEMSGETAQTKEGRGRAAKNNHLADTAHRQRQPTK